ncbi:MAG TPA: hypothetical protein VMI92_05000 [Steroidobacteraceae bacterium]|nr:hypothetical protein [Steroidobacteraceae bacterium]
MDRSPRLSALLLAALALMAQRAALAQIEKPSEEDIQAAPKGFQGLIRGTSDKIQQSSPPGGAPGAGPGGPGGPDAAKVVARQPSRDPRDFTGLWSTERGGPGGGPGAKGAAPSGFAALGTVTPTKVEVSRICLVDVGITPATTMIYQTPTQVDFVYANELRARRVYLNEKMPRDPAPTYAGTAVGHWEGNTLVIETTALKGSLGQVGFDVETGSFAVRLVSPTLRVTERITKIHDGAQLEDRRHFEDPATALVPFDQVTTYNYDPGAQVLETECEDFGDAFGPGYAAPEARR